MSLDIKKLLEVASASQVSKWELDTIIWNDRATDPDALKRFLSRIEHLESLKKPTDVDRQELEILQELADDMNQDDCEQLLSQDDEVVKQRFIEALARQGALETLCKNEVSINTMEKMCKLSPNDFILTAKRSQDLINSIQELVIQGETLSNDVAGA
jgi:hypothetical protein